MKFVCSDLLFAKENCCVLRIDSISSACLTQQELMLGKVRDNAARNRLVMPEFEFDAGLHRSFSVSQDVHFRLWYVLSCVVNAKWCWWSHICFPILLMS